MLVLCTGVNRRNTFLLCWCFVPVSTGETHFCCAGPLYRCQQEKHIFVVLVLCTGVETHEEKHIFVVLVLCTGVVRRNPFLLCWSFVPVSSGETHFCCAGPLYRCQQEKPIFVVLVLCTGVNRRNTFLLCWCFVPVSTGETHFCCAGALYRCHQEKHIFVLH